MDTSETILKLKLQLEQMTEQKEILLAENEMFKTDLIHKNQIIAEARQRIYEWKQYSEHLEKT